MIILITGAIIGCVRRGPPARTFSLDATSAGEWNRFESLPFAVAMGADPACGGRTRTTGPVLVLEVADRMPAVRLSIMSHDRRWAAMRLVAPDGAVECITPVETLVEMEDHLERRSAIATHRSLRAGTWQVWLTSDIDIASLDAATPVPFLVHPLQRSDDPDWDRHIQESLAREPHRGGELVGQQWSPATDATYDPSSGTLSTTGDACFRVFFRFTALPPPSLSISLPTGEEIAYIDARAGYAIGHADYCSTGRPVAFTALPGGAPAPIEVRVYQTDRDTSLRAAMRGAAANPALSCESCRGHLRACRRRQSSDCMREFRRCLSLSDQTTSHCPAQ